MMKNFLLLTFKSIRYRRMRSWLTILGIIIGIMLVVVIFSLGSGIQNAISKTLAMFGSDLIFVFPGKETNPLAGVAGGQKFREADLTDLEQIDGVKFVVPMDVATINVEFKGEKQTVMVHGGPIDKMKTMFTESQGVKVDQGAWPVGDDDHSVVLGYLAANSLFKNRVQIGDEIIMKSKRMRVDVILSKIGVQNDDNSMYISLQAMHDMTGRTGATAAAVKTEPGANIDIVAREIKLKLSEQDVVRDFSVLTPEKVNELVGSVLSVVELVLIVIALVSLLVGGVGIMNTMYTSVLERTKQIGILKAVGASREGILSLFLIESGIIGAIGGVLGIIFGILMAWFIGLFAPSFGITGLFSFRSLDFLGLLVILVITFTVGVIAGILPARQASKMEPAEALRYE